MSVREQDVTPAAGGDDPVDGEFVRQLAVLFTLALALRLIVAVVVRYALDGSVVLDDRTYHEMATQAAAHHTGQWDAYTHELYRQTATLLYPLTFLYRVFGSHQLLGQAFLAVFGALAAVLTARLAMEVVPRPWALAAGAVVALLPSQLLFSATTLKDALVWSTLAGLALLVAVAGRTDGPPRRLVAMAGAVVVLLVLLSHLRRHTFVVTCIALAVAGWLGLPRRRLVRGAGALLIAVTVPWTLGWGPLGVGTLPSNARLASYRSAESTGGSAIGKGNGAKAAARRTAGGVALSDLNEGQFSGNVRHLPTGISVILLRPYPWAAGGTARLNLARVETLFWYPLLALALVGLVAGRRRLRVLAFPVLVVGGLVVTDALAEGNVGTAFRHRGELVWAVVVLAAIGARRVVAARQTTSV